MTAIVVAALWRPVAWRTFAPVVPVALAAIPLPVQWLARLSPVTYDYAVAKPALWMGQSAAFRPLSLDPPATLKWVLCALAACGAFGLGASLGRDRAARRSLIERMTALLLAAPLTALGFRAAVLGLTPIPMQPDRWYPFPNANHTGLLCAIVAILAQGLSQSTSGRSRALWFAAAATSAAATLASGSRGAILILTGFSLVLWWNRAPRKIRSAAAAVLLLAATATAAVALSPGAADALRVPGLHEHARVQIWSDSVRMLRDFPVLGIGAGAFAAVYPIYRTFHPSFPAAVLAPESEWLRLALELGLPAALLLATAAFGLLIATARTGKTDTSGTLRGIGLAYAAELTAACYDIQWMTPGHLVLTASLAGMLYGARSASARTSPQPAHTSIQEGSDAVV